VAGPASGAKAKLGDRMNFEALGPNSGLKVKNNGHAIKMQALFGVMHLPDGDYEARQLTFHFPSEHAVDGVLAAGEMQITFHNTQKQGTAVVSVLLHDSALLEVDGKSRELTFLTSLGFGEHLPPKGMELEMSPDATLDMAATFGELFNGPYFHYEGSLTTPPCSESVHWYVLERPAPVTEAMIDNFKSLFADGNVRPIQPLNGRAVVVSQVATSDTEFQARAKPQPEEIKDAQHWTYDRVDKWGDAFPHCDGTSQSPVDVDTTSAITSTGASTVLSQLVKYKALSRDAEVYIVNNGHTVQLKGTFGMMKLPDGDYEARQIHFHFPSEHAIDGVLAAGEMTIVHHNTKNKSHDSAMVSILLHDAQSLVETKGTKGELEFFEDLGFDAELPRFGESHKLGTKMNLAETFARQLQGGYFHYKGSLTTPPCSQSVHWFIAQHPAAVNKSVISYFRKLFAPNLRRPLQPLNGRNVVINMVEADLDEYESEDKDTKKEKKTKDSKKTGALEKDGSDEQQLQEAALELANSLWVQRAVRS